MERAELGHLHRAQGNQRKRYGKPRRRFSLLIESLLNRGPVGWILQPGKAFGGRTTQGVVFVAQVAVEQSAAAIVGDHGDGGERRPPDLHAASPVQHVDQIGKSFLILQDAVGLDRGQLYFLVKVAQQVAQFRRDIFVADLLYRDQRFVDYGSVFRFHGFEQVRDGLPAAENADGARRIGPRFHADTAAGELAKRRDHFRTHLDIGFDDLVVGVGELALDALAHPLQLRAQARAHVAGQVEIHQAVGGANLDFGVAVACGFDQWIEAALRADVHDGFDCLDADVEIGILEQSL